MCLVGLPVRGGAVGGVMSDLQAAGPRQNDTDALKKKCL